jgi:hypothetical protein
MSRKQQPQWTEISVEVDGKLYEGTYSVQGRAITVRYGMAEQSTHVSGGPATSEVRMLLRELVRGEAPCPNPDG